MISNRRILIKKISMAVFSKSSITEFVFPNVFILLADFADNLSVNALDL